MATETSQATPNGTKPQAPPAAPTPTECEPELFELTAENRAKFLRLYEWEHRGVPEKQRMGFHEWFDGHIGELATKAAKYVADTYYRRTLRACDDMAAARGVTRAEMAKILGFVLRAEDGGAKA